MGGSKGPSEPLRRGGAGERWVLQEGWSESAYGGRTAVNRPSGSWKGSPVKLSVLCVASGVFPAAGILGRFDMDPTGMDVAHRSMCGAGVNLGRFSLWKGVKIGVVLGEFRLHGLPEYGKEWLIGKVASTPGRTCQDAGCDYRIAAEWLGSGDGLG